MNLAKNLRKYFRRRFRVISKKKGEQYEDYEDKEVFYDRPSTFYGPYYIGGDGSGC